MSVDVPSIFSHDISMESEMSALSTNNISPPQPPVPSPESSSSVFSETVLLVEGNLIKKHCMIIRL